MNGITRTAPHGMDKKSLRQRERRLRHINVRRRWQLFLFLLIPVIWVLIFNYAPMVGIQIAFRKYKIRDGIWGSRWVGMANFTKFFGSYQFQRVLVNTIRVSLYSLAAGFPLPIVLALCMNALTNQRYKKFIQTLTYIPHFISTVVMVGMLMQIFNSNTGLYGRLGWLFTGQRPDDILSQASVFPHMYVWSGVWQGMGWSSIIYMAALSSVDASLHEAAEIDGASRFQRCIYIDFPCILPTATILLIMNAGNIMSVGFEKV
ncbi:MAG: ABC transporter permease, partial [Candidatus Fimadaptatus sp.]